MVLSRRFISSRPVVGILVLLIVFLVAGWGYSLSIWNKVLNFYIGLLVINPAVVWSLYEIFRLRREELGKLFWFYLLLDYLVLITPICLLPYLELRLTYRLLILIVSLSITWFFSRLSNLGNNWVDFENLFRGKSFTHLVLCACLFWNALFSLIFYSRWLIVSLGFILIMLNDSCALIFGKLFGKRSLSIYSASKTKEGMWLSVVFVSLLVFVVLLTMPTYRSYIFGDKSYWWVSLPLIFIGLLISHWGDLHFSMHKRIYGIKDYSGLLGSHGGFWDRFDSACFAISFIFLIFIICNVFQ